MKDRTANLLRIIRNQARTLYWHVKERSRVLKDTEGVPIPPGHLLFLVTGSFDASSWYLSSGKLDVQNMHDVLKKNDVEIDAFSAILDFGCGCGRILRHMPRLTGAKLFGCDHNRKLVEWCRNNLRFARLQQNQIHKKLDYPGHSFDFIYAFSVFTHLTDLQNKFWIDELRRVLRPGGYLYFTTHGRAYEARIPNVLKEQFRAGKFVAKGEDLPGGNYCASFHPERYVREELTRGFTIVDFIEKGTPEHLEQDAYLMLKTSG